MHNASKASRPRRISSPHSPAIPADAAAATDGKFAQVGEAGSRLALLADDNRLFRELLRAILTRHFPDMMIAEADDGSRAAALDQLLHPQLVFMDINLPERNGLDLTRQFKAFDPSVLVCLLTQYDLPEYRIAARECGADQLIVKEESTEASIVAMVKAGLSGHPEGLEEKAFDERACVPQADGP